MGSPSLARYLVATPLVAHCRMMDSLVDRHQDKIAGVLCCWDRVVVQGTLPGLCYAAGMTSYLKASHIRVFDYPRFAEPLRDQIRENAESLARKAGVEVEFMRKSSYRKEARIKDVLAKRGDHAGLHIRTMVLPHMLTAES